MNISISSSFTFTVGIIGITRVLKVQMKQIFKSYGTSGSGQGKRPKISKQSIFPDKSLYRKLQSKRTRRWLNVSRLKNYKPILIDVVVYL